MPIWGENSFANLTGEMLDLELKTAEEEIGPNALIGGSVQIVSLSENGIEEGAGHQIVTDGIPELTWYPKLRP